MKSARELSMVVLANSPESGKILSIGMSRFSGYKSGASTTGQRSWGKSEKQHHFCLILQSDRCWGVYGLYWTFVPRQRVFRKASICSCPTPLAPFWPNSRWESSRCNTSIGISWKPPSWFPPRSASTYERRRSGSFCLMNCAAIAKNQFKIQNFLCFIINTWNVIQHWSQ